MKVDASAMVGQAVICACACDAASVPIRKIGSSRKTAAAHFGFWAGAAAADVTGKTIAKSRRSAATASTWLASQGYERIASGDA